MAGEPTLFLCGDVMTGRGIDQILPNPVHPRLHESYMRSANGYVELAEKANGPIPRRVQFSYIWGEALQQLEKRRPDLRIINLETSITTSEDAVPKGINYRMHPANADCLTAAKIDCCVLANNHVLDWGYRGLAETLDTLRKAGVKTAGAGQTLADAMKPAAMQVRNGMRVLLFAVAESGSGVPAGWAAAETGPGVAWIPELSQKTATSIAANISEERRPGDIVVVSVHWGPNWGYTIPEQQQVFARTLIDRRAADIVYGHSSHHPKGIEVYRNRLILYGCGDFLNDYEGIGGYEEFRTHLVLMYFATLEGATRELSRLEMKPLQIKRFQLQSTEREDDRWLRDMLNREGSVFGTRAELRADGVLELLWR